MNIYAEILRMIADLDERHWSRQLTKCDSEFIHAIRDKLMSIANQIYNDAHPKEETNETQETDKTPKILF